MEVRDVDEFVGQLHPGVAHRQFPPLYCKGRSEVWQIIAFKWLRG